MDGAEQSEDGAQRKEGKEGEEDETCSEKDPERPPSAQEPVSVKEGSIECEDCGLTFEQWDDYQTHLHQHALDEEEAIAEDGKISEPDDEENTDKERSKTTSGQMDQRTILTCPICGKVYSYVSSYTKHLKIHEEKPNEPTPRAVKFSNMAKYDCPECGLSFIRRTRLLSHLRVHNEDEIPVPRCDQCNKSFTSEKSWIAHIELHNQKPFWCLSCALGFRSEDLLDKHLQNHSLKQRKQSTDVKNVPINTQKEEKKPNECKYCGKTFCHPGKLMSHQKKHLRGFARSRFLKDGTPEDKAKLAEFENKIVLSTVEEEQGVMEGLGSEENGLENQGESTQEEIRDCVKGEDSDCEQPPSSKRSRQSGSPGYKSDESKPETTESLEEGEHKYKEWECFDCDMSFDEVAELRLHYIKHATGELPMLNDIEG